MAVRIPAERQRKILEMLKDNSAMRVADLAGSLGVSEMTIRRDLDAMDRKGLLERTHGGALAKQPDQPSPYRFEVSVSKLFKEKKRIAKRAAELIQPNDVVFIGEGATAGEILNYIDPELNCTIISNNVSLVGYKLDIKAKLIILSGVFDRDLLALTGTMTTDQIHKFNANKVFIGIDGLSLENGATDMSLECAEVDRTMIAQTHGQTICLADHTKFNLTGTHVVAPINEIDVIISDRQAPAQFVEKTADHGVQTFLV